MLVSIIVCNHNYARFLDHAIASAVAQTGVEREIIVVDDGSTDDSARIIARWKDQITAIFQSNEGQTSAYNRGFDEARGEIVIYLDSDDALEPQACERVAAAFADPDVVKVHFRLRLIDVNNTPMGVNIPHLLSDGDMSQKLLKSGSFYDSSPGSGNAYRRSALARIMPLPVVSHDRHGADFFALLGICLLGKVRALQDEPLGSYRIHAEQAREQMLFGNLGLHEPKKTNTRYSRLRTWLIERLGEDYALPRHFANFSVQKLVFAESVLGPDAYWDGVRSGSAYLKRTLARAIWLRQSSLPEKVGLFGWALGVIVLPRSLGRSWARFVCNPASRMGSVFA